MALPFVGGYPVGRRAVARRQHPFAGLQADAVPTFQTFEDFFRLLPALGDDFGQLFEK